MDVRPGYKQTAVGVIPEEWNIKPLIQIAETYSGGTPSTSISDYYGGDIPWITSSDLNVNPIWEVSGRITRRGLENSATKKVKKNSILFALYGATAGVTAITKIDATINQAILAIVPIYDNIDYLFQYFKYKKNWVINTYTQGGQPNLSGDIVRSLLIPLPPLLEQRAIAAALSDVDAQIIALCRLIAKKRDIKQAAMQELLTGKRRLPGFSEGWSIKELLDISPLQRGFDLPTTKIIQGTHPVVYSNGVQNYHTQFMVKGPGVVTGRSGTIGSVHYIEQNFWPHNTSLWVTDFKQNIPKYVYYLYLFIGFEKFGTGSGVPTLNRNDVHAHQVSIPNSSKEQTVIATILSDMDAELAALEQKRDKIKAIKQGMMQELLTGRIRLV